MATRPRAHAQTPGSTSTPTLDNGETDMDALADAAPDFAAEDADPEEPLTVTKRDLARMVAAEVAKAVAAKAAAARDPVTSKPLPDESTIDPHKIDRPVLSAQGWVVPVTYGAAPAHLQRAPE